MDRKIIDYGVCANEKVNHVIDLMKANIERDWQPHGSMIIAPFGYVQPMVRYEESSEIEALRVSLADVLIYAQAYYNLVTLPRRANEPLPAEFSTLADDTRAACHRARVLLKQTEGEP